MTKFFYHLKNRNLLKNAPEHVGYDDQIEQYLKQQANSQHPNVKEFANSILQDFNSQDETPTSDKQSQP